jgi:hypothetical protein
LAEKVAQGNCEMAGTGLLGKGDSSGREVLYQEVQASEVLREIYERVMLKCNCEWPNSAQEHFAKWLRVGVSHGGLATVGFPQEFSQNTDGNAAPTANHDDDDDPHAIIHRPFLRERGRPRDSGDEMLIRADAIYERSRDTVAPTVDINGRHLLAFTQPPPLMDHAGDINGDAARFAAQISRRRRSSAGKAANDSSNSSSSSSSSAAPWTREEEEWVMAHGESSSSSSSAAWVEPVPKKAAPLAPGFVEATHTRTYDVALTKAGKPKYGPMPLGDAAQRYIVSLYEAFGDKIVETMLMKNLNESASSIAELEAVGEVDLPTTKYMLSGALAGSVLITACLMGKDRTRHSVLKEFPTTPMPAAWD